MHRVHKVLRQLDRSPNIIGKNDVHAFDSKGTIGLFGVHDVGGTGAYVADDLEYTPADIDDRDKTLTYWERKIDALGMLLPPKCLWTFSEMRAATESLPKNSYMNIAYYEKWVYAVLKLCLSKGIFSEKELMAKYHQHPQIIKLKNGKEEANIQKFK